MRKTFLVCMLLLCGTGSAQAELAWNDISCGNTGLTGILTDSADSALLYAGSRAGVLKSLDGGKNWRNVLPLRGGGAGVNLLYFNIFDNKIVYAVTSRGLYRSNNRGENWLRIFRGSNYLDGDCTALAVLPEIIYLGTRGGLFASRDNGRSWSRESGRIGKEDIKAIGCSLKDKFIYVASCGGIYRAIPGEQEWGRIFVAYPQADNGDREEAAEKEETDNGAQINYLSVEQTSGDIYVATRRGVYRSIDRGQSWKSLADYGLLSRNVKFILAARDSRVYAVTDSGIFLYFGERWLELSFGLAAGELRAVACDKEDNLYAASEMGLFRAVIKDRVYDESDNSAVCRYQGELQINEVQQAAIKYAEVDPEKIIRWRKQAARRAILPKLTISADRDRNSTISNSIWGTAGSSSSPGKYFVGPDDETRYHNNGWGVSLSWELGDLVWNDAQTSIDVRSRLMVELRNDILDEVTRVYFERLRVKAELDGLSIEDRNKRQIKELRVAELTALLDAMTGGYFSRALKK
ncbi:MAG: hypothetical protein WC469_04565 [Candidatus Omnitrophota bacterium]